MEIEPQRYKIEASYDLREAVEIKADAEHQLAADGTDEARDALLAAQQNVEAQTQDAIEVHRSVGRVMVRRDNVIKVDFGRPEGS
jgi:hypothetical protein